MVGWTRRIHTDGKETQKKDAEREIGGQNFGSEKMGCKEAPALSTWQRSVDGRGGKGGRGAGEEEEEEEEEEGLLTNNE